MKNEGRIILSTGFMVEKKCIVDNDYSVRCAKIIARDQKNHLLYSVAGSTTNTLHQDFYK